MMNALVDLLVEVHKGANKITLHRDCEFFLVIFHFFI
jgi:hypothetical protein